MAKVIFKYEGESHQFILGLDQTTKSVIEKQIKEKWGLDFDELTMTYRDSDGDQINVDNENDFLAAKETMDGDSLLVFQVQLNIGAIPKFPKTQQPKYAEGIESHQVGAEKKEENFSDEKQKKQGKNASEEKKRKNEEKNLKKIEQQQKRRADAEGKKKAKEEMEIKKKEQAEKKQNEKLLKEAQRKAAAEKKEAEKREKLEKQKKQKPVKQESPKLEEDTKLSEQKIRDLIRSQVFKMMPQIKDAILQKHQPKPHELKQVKKEPGYSLAQKCSTCNSKLVCPFYFKPQNKQYICAGCEQIDESLEGLVKIRNPNHFSQTVYTYAGFVKRSDFAEILPVNYNEKLKELLIVPIKSQFKTINQLLKKSLM